MTTAKIGDFISRNLSRKIEEIVKVAQADEESVYTELTEYVATASLRQHYRAVLGAIAEAPTDPHEGVGIWVSGFFGSGKSSFAKNLGYVLANRTLLGERAADLFSRSLGDERCAALIENINSRIPTEVVMFDVQTDKGSGGSGNVTISHYMYRSLLRALDYAEDFDIAELEQTLEADGRLDAFIEHFEARHRAEFEKEPERFREQLQKERWRWSFRRMAAHKMNEASAILHELDPRTFPQADSWARSQGDRRVEITPKLLVEKTFALAERRRPGKAILFIIDEVGAYVARSAEKIEDLRFVVEEFGRAGKNLLKARRIPAPAWIVVTSQEKLDEVVAAIDSKRVELAKLLDRFRYRIDLAPADIREVATRRVLAKNDKGESALAALYRDYEGTLNEHLRLDSGVFRSHVTPQDFVEFYPYPPHFVDLSIAIMHGIRLEPGAAKHLGGSNRTIIKQAFEMLVSERTRLKDAPVGRLVTLDLIFELVEGNLSSEKRHDITAIRGQFGEGSWEVRVAKAIVLLEYVKGLTRSEGNLAATLYDRVEATTPLPSVKTALERLKKATFIRYTEEGYKLQTQSEKTWETERRNQDPRPRDRAELNREVVHEVLSDPKLRTYNYKGLRNFRLGLTVDDLKMEEGQVPLRVVIADDSAGLATRLDAVRMQSREKEHQNEIFWAFALSPEIDEQITELYRSRQMVAKYEHLRGQGSISPEQQTCLAQEKNEAVRIHKRLRERFTLVIEGGTGFHDGKGYEGAALGKGLQEIIRKLCDHTVPALYPKLELGARHLQGGEAEEVLKAANLSGLSQVFYEGEQGLSLVIKDGGKYVPSPTAPVAQEIVDFIQRRSAYGEKVTGKDLEERFCGMGYGWERDLIRVVLAVLLRAGAIEVTHQGRRFRNHQDAACRVPFTNATAFRAASFTPRESVGLKTLAAAAERYEEITGQEVDIEEGAIAQAFKKVAEQEIGELLPLLATARAHRLPGVPALEEYQAALRSILDGATDDCVRILASEGKSFQEAMERARRMRAAITEPRLQALGLARRAVTELWPAIRDREVPPELEGQVATLKELSEGPAFFDSLDRIEALSAALRGAYRSVYRALHERRREVFYQAEDSIKGRREWTEIPEELQRPLLAPLRARQCEELKEWPESALLCPRCAATLAQMESDIAAAGGLRAEVLGRIQTAAAPKERIERVTVARMCDEPLDSRDAVIRFVDTLRDHLLKLIDEGARIVVE